MCVCSSCLAFSGDGDADARGRPDQDQHPGGQEGGGAHQDTRGGGGQAGGREEERSRRQEEIKNICPFKKNFYFCHQSPSVLGKVSSVCVKLVGAGLDLVLMFVLFLLLEGCDIYLSS